MIELRIATKVERERSPYMMWVNDDANHEAGEDGETVDIRMGSETVAVYTAGGVATATTISCARFWTVTCT